MPIGFSTSLTALNLHLSSTLPGRSHSLLWSHLLSYSQIVWPVGSILPWWVFLLIHSVRCWDHPFSRICLSVSDSPIVGGLVWFDLQITTYKPSIETLHLPLSRSLLLFTISLNLSQSLRPPVSLHISQLILPSTNPVPSSSRHPRLVCFSSTYSTSCSFFARFLFSQHGSSSIAVQQVSATLSHSSIQRSETVSPYRGLCPVQHPPTCCPTSSVPGSESTGAQLHPISSSWMLTRPEEVTYSLPAASEIRMGTTNWWTVLVHPRGTDSFSGVGHRSFNRHSSGAVLTMSVAGHSLFALGNSRLLRLWSQRTGGGLAHSHWNGASGHPFVSFWSPLSIHLSRLSVYPDFVVSTTAAERVQEWEGV